MDDFQDIGDPIDKLYSTLKKRGYYTKSIGEFKQKYNLPENIDKLYEVVNRDGLYTKTKDDFYKQYYPTATTVTPKKKEDTGLPGGSQLSSSDRDKVLGYVQGLKQQPTTQELSTAVQKSAEKNKPLVATTPTLAKQSRVEKLLKEIPEEEGIADPLKAINKISPDKPMTLESLEAQKEASDIILKRMAGDGYDAQQILNTSHFGSADRGNMTASVLRKKAREYEVATTPLRELKFGDLEGADDKFIQFNTGQQIDNAAIKWYAQKYPSFQKELSAAGIDINDPVLADMVGSGKAGHIIAEFLNDADVGTYLSKENPSLIPAVESQAKNLITKYKDYGVNVVANKISRAIQESGYNNIDPIFNFANENVKSLANTLAKSTLSPEEYSIYEKNILGKEEDYLDTPSFFEGFASSGKGFGQGIVNTFTEPFTPVSETIKENWDKEASHVSADPKGLTKAIRDMGHATGFVASIGATGNVLGGAGMTNPQTASGFATAIGFLGDELERGRVKYPDSPVKAWTSAILNTGAYVALTRDIFPAEKVKAAFTKISPGLDKVVENLASGKITREAARADANTLIKDAMKIAGESVKSNTKVSAEMMGITIMNKYLDKVMGLDEDKFKKFHPNGEESDTFTGMFLSNSLVAGLSSYGKIRRENKIAQEAYYQAATNPKMYERIIEELVIQDPTVSKEELLSNLKYLSEVKRELDNAGIPVKKQKQYLSESIKEKVNSDNIKKMPDSNMIRTLEEDIKRSQEIKQGILEGKEPEEIVTTEQQDAIDENVKQEADRNKLIEKGQKAIDKLLEEKDENDKPVFKGMYRDIAKADPMGFLEEIANQAQGVTKEGEPLPGGGREIDMIPQYGADIINVAKELFPANKKQKEVKGEPEQISQPIELSTESEVVGSGVGGDKKVYIHETDSPTFDKFDINKSGTGQGEAWLGKGIYLQEKGTVKLESYGKNKVEAVLKPEAKIFDVTETPNGKYRDSFVEWAVENTEIGKRKAKERIDEGLSLKNLLPRDILKNSPEAVEKLKEQGYDGLNQDGELVIYNSDMLEINKPKEVKAEQPTPTQEAVGELPPTVPPSTPTTKGPYIERPGTELSFRGLQNVANEFGLEDVTSRETKSDVQLFADARNTANEWIEKGEYAKNIEKLLQGVESGDISLRDEQRVILQQYLANEVQKLRDIQDKNSPEWQKQFEVVKRIKEVGNIARSEAGAALRIPVGGYSHPIKDYGDALVALEEVTGKELTPEQKSEVEKYVADYEEKLKIAEEKVLAAEQKYAELQAKKEVGETVKKTKKTNKDYSTERKKIVTDIREKLKKIRQEQNVTVVPYAKELFAIAPDVAKLVKSLVEQGISKLDDIVTEIHNTLKDDIPDIQENDVVDIIAGKYNEPKETRADLEKKLKQIGNKNSAEAVKIRAKIKAGDFEKPQKAVSWVDNQEFKKNYPKAYNEAIDALAAREEAMHDYDILLAKEELAQMKGKQKLGFWVKGVLSTTKALASGIDFSGIGMQNLVAMVSHPRSAIKALPQSFIDLASQKTFTRRLTALHNSEAWSDIKNSGLDITDPKSLRPESKEEIFSGNLLDRQIKLRGKKYILSKYITKPFERQFTSLGNNMRVNMFLRVRERWQQKGKTFESDPEAYKSLAKLLNTQTGRGDVPKAIKDGTTLVNSIIWSPRLIASRLNLLGISELREVVGGKGFYTQLTPEIRRMAITDMVKFIGAGAGLMAMAAYWGAEIDDDPESPTFGTIKIDGKSYNAWGGFTPYVKTIWQSMSGKRKSGNKEKPTNAGELLMRFGRGRLTPAAGAAVNVAFGKDYSGKPVTPQSQLLNMIAPISIKGISEGLEKDGLKGIITQGIPSMVGIGVSDERDFKKKDPAGGKPSMPKLPKKPDK